MAEESKSYFLYLIGFDPQRKKWFAADDMLGLLTENSGTMLEVSEDDQKFRFVQEGPEADMDFDNMEILGEFLRKYNDESEEPQEQS